MDSSPTLAGTIVCAAEMWGDHRTGTFSAPVHRPDRTAHVGAAGSGGFQRLHHRAALHLVHLIRGASSILSAPDCGAEHDARIGVAVDGQLGVGHVDGDRSTGVDAAEADLLFGDHDAGSGYTGAARSFAWFGVEAP